MQTDPAASRCQRSPSALWQQVLPVLLQHPSVLGDQSIVCRLLACSKNTAAAVHEYCAGQVVVRHCRLDYHNQWRGFWTWLSKHGQLMGKLELDLPAIQEHGGSDDSSTGSNQPGSFAVLSGSHRLHAQAAVAGALQQGAAAHPRALALHSVSTCSPSAAVLRSLPVNTLTHLDLAFDFNERRPLREVAAALAGLIGLRTMRMSLALYSDPGHDGEEEQQGFGAQPEHVYRTDAIIMPALASLRQLTSLELTDICSTKLEWQHLPPSLVALTLLSGKAWEGEEEGDGQDSSCVSRPLQLAHLTALTQLDMAEVWWTVDAHDVMPPNIEVLDMNDFEDALPLLQLSRLRELAIIGATSTPAAQLLQLSSLSSLQELNLTYVPASSTDAAAVAEAAAVWSVLPGELTVNLCACKDGDNGFETLDLTAAMLQHLAKAQHVTRLLLTNCKVATPQQLAALQPLTRLKELHLTALEMQQAEGGASSTTAGLTELMAAVAQLPQLQGLDCEKVLLPAAAVSQLRAATQLTGFRFLDCSLSEDAVQALCSLTGLTGIGRVSCQPGGTGCAQHVRGYAPGQQPSQTV